jgi:putative iron-dependent peroxidase
MRLSKVDEVGGQGAERSLTNHRIDRRPVRWRRTVDEARWTRQGGQGTVDEARWATCAAGRAVAWRFMVNPQGGIFALGTAAHAYLEFDVLDPRHAADVVRTIAGLREPRTTMGGVNLVSGFRPQLWRAVAPADCPAEVSDFTDDVVGPDGYAMPGTQHDAVLWLSGSAYDVVFDTARAAIAELAALAVVAEETSSWPYRHDRDLTGFIDGTENPTLVEAPEVALVPESCPGAAGTVLLIQKWEHDAAAWESLPVPTQERVMGRTKLDSVELADQPVDSHVARTDQERFGDIFRRNMPYGTVTRHGTVFVGFSAEQRRLSDMLDSMVGRTTGTRDALTFYTRPITGAYYFVPSIEALQRHSQVVDLDRGVNPQDASAKDR